MQVVFTRAGVARGARATLPLVLGLLPFGLVTGVVADGAGLSLLETVLMSALVFAGSSQLLALSLWSEPAPILTATLAACAVNSRLIPMGAALAPWLDRLQGWRLWGTLATLVDHSFAMSVVEQRAGQRDAGYLLGVGAASWTVWVVCVALGHIGGAVVRLPSGHPLFFAATAAIVALLVPIWRGRGRDLLPWCAAGLLAWAAHRAGLPQPLPLLAGGLAGAALGALNDRRRT